MRKRLNFDVHPQEPPAKKLAGQDVSSLGSLKSGTVVTDLSGQRWKLGKTVGTGAFGEIHLASDDVSRDVKMGEAKFVAKVEAHTSGPLFVEINCYLRIAKEEMISGWKEKQRIGSLGMPHYVSSGSHVAGKVKYRFLIIPIYDTDLHKIFEQRRCKFNLKTVLTIGIQTLDILRYIHSQGYIHSDIKASNIMLNLRKSRPRSQVSSPSSRTKTFVRYYGCTPVRSCKVRKVAPPRSLRLNDKMISLNNCIEEVRKDSGSDQIYLVDYGLASKYLSGNGVHKSCSGDERKAHAGTILFCSRDAHRGAQSRRSDLESLGYNMIYWLTSNLPWSENTEEPDRVYKLKGRCMDNVKEFLFCTFKGQYPQFLLEYFLYLKKLDFECEPDYEHCKNLFERALIDFGYKNNNLLDFDNSEGWGRKQKTTKSKILENGFSGGHSFMRSPLKSNLAVKPRLRTKAQNKKIKNAVLHWSKILMDPECIMKQLRERKVTEPSDNGATGGILNLDLNRMNPNPAMIEVYNNAIDRLNNCNGLSPAYGRDQFADHIDGYTPAMMTVFNRKTERERWETEQLALTQAKAKKNTKVAKAKKQKKESRPPAKTMAPDAYSPPRTRRFGASNSGRRIRKAQFKTSYSLRG